jgi:hypothetical protein
LILSVLALGVLITVGAAYDDTAFEAAQSYGSSHGGDSHNSGGDNHNNGGNPDHGDNHGDYHGDYHGGYYDWLNPGGYYYSYSWYPYSYTYYPTYYTYPTYTYPVYTPPVYTPPAYTYPTYTYTTPVYTTGPGYYDPWYAANVYGYGGTTYYYSSSWSYSAGGMVFY